MTTNAFLRCALLVGAWSFSPVAHVIGQQLAFYRGIRDSLVPGISAQAIAIGDTNRDGITDVVLAPCCDKLLVLFGTGNGAFVAGPESPTSDGDKSELISSDFNGDGKLDIIVISRSFFPSPYASFHAGDGTGRFGPPVILDISSGQALAAADINGDNKPDLVRVDPNSRVSVLRNSDGGTFAPAVSDMFLGGSYLAIGDLNRDGRQDVVAAVRTRFSPSIPAIAILLGTPEGELERVATFPSGRVDLMGLGDFNRDGIPDIAKVNNDPAVQTLATFHGKGDGTFGEPLYQKLRFRPAAFGVGDVNRDSVDDLVLTSLDGESIVRRGNGDGTFTNVVSPTVSERAYGRIFVTDVNRDGNQDALIGLRFSTVSVLISNGDGTLRQPPSFHLPAETSGAAGGDFNGDTLTDFAVANSTSGTVSVFLTNPAGGLTSLGPSNAPGVFSIYSADFNGDQKLDLINVPSTRDAIRVLLGNGNGTFSALAPISLPGLQLFAPAIGDFTGDSKPDVILGSEASGSFVFLRGNGDGTFTFSSSFPAPGTRLRAYAAGEFTGDGKLDLAVVSNTNLRLIPGNGNGTFGSPSGVIFSGTFADELIAGDINSDLRTDLIMGGIRVFLGNGNSTFQPPRSYFDTFDPERGLAIGDLNGDGIRDVYFVTYRGGNNTGVMLGRGDGTFFPTRFFAAGREPLLAIPIRYFDADSKPDLAVVNADSNTVTLLVNVTGAATIE